MIPAEKPNNKHSAYSKSLLKQKPNMEQSTVSTVKQNPKRSIVCSQTSKMELSIYIYQKVQCGTCFLLQSQNISIISTVKPNLMLNTCRKNSTVKAHDTNG
jgi:hypothetical protein